MSIVNIQDLKKYFGKIKAVDGISFEVQEGEIFGYLGPNGAGKTTTISMMMGFIKPTYGLIDILGIDAYRNRHQNKAEIGYLSSDVHLYENLNAFEHFALVEGIRGKSQNLDQLKEDFNFDFKQKVHHLSTGTKQKLGIILCLMTKPKLLILDEPTRGLDPLLQNMFYEYMINFKNQGNTIFMSSHNLSEVEKMCDHIGIIKNGKLVTVETIISLKNKRIHQLKLRTKEPLNLEYFKNHDSIEIVNNNSEYDLMLKIKGEVDPIIKLVNQYTVIDLEITPASLEDIFMEFYA